MGARLSWFMLLRFSFGRLRKACPQNTFVVKATLVASCRPRMNNKLPVYKRLIVTMQNCKGELPSRI